MTILISRYYDIIISLLRLIILLLRLNSRYYGFISLSFIKFFLFFFLFLKFDPCSHSYFNISLLKWKSINKWDKRWCLWMEISAFLVFQYWFWTMRLNRCRNMILVQLFSVKPGFMHLNSHDDWIVFYAVSVIDEVNIRIWDSVAWDDGTMIDLQKIM